MAGGTQDGVEVRSILLQVFRLLVPLAPLGLSQKHTLSSARNQNIAHGNRSSGLQVILSFISHTQGCVSVYYGTKHKVCIDVLYYTFYRFVSLYPTSSTF